MQRDTFVTLTCDDSIPLEERVELLAYSFAKMVQGSILRRVVCWDITHGTIKFILGHIDIKNVPRGAVQVRLEEVPPGEQRDVNLHVAHSIIGR